MHLRYRSVLLLVAICTALAVAPAFAAKLAPTAGPTPTTVEGHIGPTTANASCQLGINAAPINAFGYILPPDDEYMVLMDPANCTACAGPGGGTGPVQAKIAHIVLLFTEACQIPVSVDIVGAVNNGGCWQPNPFDSKCQPVQYLIDDGGLAGQGLCVDYGLTLGPDCLCFTTPVFLRFRFDAGSCNSGRPAFCGPASCNNCTEYNYYPGATFPGDDLCSTLTPFGYYGIIAYADVNCCPVPTLPGSWGKVKTIYR